MRIYYRPGGDPRLEWIIMPDAAHYLDILFDWETAELMTSPKPKTVEELSHAR